ncbi:MAG: SMP-30/gluconolactonase/LRE family protein [Pseudomonadota bacterium]
MTTTKTAATNLNAECCRLGEGPNYDRHSDTAWWFDILDQKLLEHRFASASTTVHNLPRMGSVLARIDADRQLVVMDDGIYERQIADGQLARIAELETDNDNTRSNDGRVHPSGRLWIGTMGKKAEDKAGTIYWFDGAEVRTLYRNITIPNSICFSADGRTGYFADTGQNIVWRVALDPQDGTPIGDPEVFVTGNELPSGGKFDGSVIDKDGVVWNAAWGSGSVCGFAPDGTLVRSFEVPAAKPTCPVFVGGGLTKMLVTTAWQGYSKAERIADPEAGHTFVLDGQFNGQPEPDFHLVER